MTDTVRWGFLDSVVATFSPRTARRRYAERLAIAEMRRSYDGASRGPSTGGWRAGNKSADAEIAATGSILRDRMRDLVRNDALAAQAVQVLVNNIVGAGIRPRAKSGNKRLDKKINAAWRRFEKRCDFHGHTDFHGLTALAVREMIEGGEVLALQRFTRAGAPGEVPLKIELREGDHLDASKAMFGNDGSRIEQGIEYNAEGRRIAYWMFPDHPGGSAQAFGRRFTSERVPAASVAHLFERQRVQNRGAPWGVAAMRAMRDFGDWHRAELARKKTEACLAAIIISDDAGTEVGGTGTGTGGGLGPAVLDADGNRIETFMPGMIGYSHSGRDVKFNQPSAAGGVGEWTKAQMHIIAAGFRVPYALMSGDMREANFSSARVGLNEFRRMVEQIQWMTVIPMFCQPIWDWFILASRTAGLIPTGGTVDVEWAPPRFESVNPKQDAEADLLEVRAGFSTLAQKIAARGYDPEEVLEEWKAMAKLTDDAGLVFDSDPRRINKGLGLQAPSQGAADAETDPRDDDSTDDAAEVSGQTE